MSLKDQKDLQYYHNFEYFSSFADGNKKKNDIILMYLGSKNFGKFFDIILEKVL